MKPRTLISMLVALAALAGGGWWWYSKNQAAAQPQLRTGKIERGTLTATDTDGTANLFVAQGGVAGQWAIEPQPDRDESGLTG
jgi:VCBS repeat-containing protein